MTLEDSIDELRGEISDILDDLISGRPTPPLGRSIFGLHRRLDRLADLLKRRAVLSTLAFGGRSTGPGRPR